MFKNNDSKGNIFHFKTSHRCLLFPTIYLCIFYSGGTIVTASGKNMDSVEEPVMVVTVSTMRGVNTYYQVYTQL